jgi:hypothetical protein
MFSLQHPSSQPIRKLPQRFAIRRLERSYDILRDSVVHPGHIALVHCLSVGGGGFGDAVVSAVLMRRISIAVR